MNGIVVGRQPENGTMVYRVVLYGENEQYSRQAVPEQNLINAIATNKITLDNVGVVKGKLKGITGDLSRFDVAAFHPMVVVSEMVIDNNIIGYRLATFDGKVKAVRLKDVMAYCNRVNGVGAPIQNAIFVPETETVKCHLRAYPGAQFKREVIQRRKPEAAQPAVVNKKENAKQVSKLEELFTPAQIKQLKLGKQSGVDIRIFGNNKLSAEQMKELRLALESGVNAAAFADPAYSVSAMKALRINGKYGIDVTYIVNPKFNAEQISELSAGYLSGVDIAKYADPKLSAKDMSKERIYLECQLWREVEAQSI